MSRLIVKNLPAYLDEGRLKAHFAAQYPAITDVKIVRRPDGTSRRFGFVGFKNGEDAQKAIQYFDRTFVDTARISVGVAKAISDGELQAKAEQRKKHKSGMVDVRETVDAPSSHDSPHHVQNSRQASASASTSASASKSAKASGAKNITFDDFLQVMAPRSKRKSWQNEDEGSSADKTKGNGVVDDDAEPTAKKIKRQAASSTLGKDNDAKSLEEESSADTVANDEGVTDLEYMYKRMRRRVGEELDEGKAFEQSDDEAEDAPEDIQASHEESAASPDTDANEDVQKHKDQQEQILKEEARKDQEDVDTVMESGRLFVRNLPFNATEEDLEAYFAQYGSVTQAHITLDKKTKKSKGIAFVSFQEPSHALAAFRAADGSTFQGRLLHVLPAVSLHQPSNETTKLKASRKKALKDNSSKDFNWGTLYMSADAVASSVASRLNIDKADLLTEQSESGKGLSPAVRLALAETTIIQETKEYLASEGIDMQAFEESNQPRKRSDTVLLVKNIPFGTSVDTLRDLFLQHGAVSRIVMPPSGTIAIVEMDVPGEAKVAFKALAYKRIGNSLMYLEKAPLGAMQGIRKPPESATKGGPTNAFLAAQAAKDAESRRVPTPESTADSIESSSTLFVKNLSFSTTDERLAMAFSKLNGFAFARIQKRATRRRDGQGEVKISMGYGFVGFLNVAAAMAAQKTMDKTSLDGHILSVNMAKRGHDGQEAGGLAGASQSASQNAVPGDEEDIAKLAPSAKLIVKNLSFQASRRDVQALFAAHGKLKSVRVPKKGMASGGGTAAGVRGFAFVEFVSRREALSAYRALRHSHLLGRHLVLDWDTEGSAASGSGVLAAGEGVTAQAVERLRQKAARGMAASASAAAGGNANRRDKLRLGDEDIRKAAVEEQRRMKGSDQEDDSDEE